MSDYIRGYSSATVDDVMIQMINLEEQQAEEVSLKDHVINPDDIVPPDNTRNPLFAAFAKKKEKGTRSQHTPRDTSVT